MKATRTEICKLEELDDPGSRGFSIEIDNDLIEGFVVLTDGQLYAYRNQCPHTGAPLDWVEHQFLDMDKQLIQCAVHDARFELDSGLCVAGPCTGEALTALKVEHDGNVVFLY